MNHDSWETVDLPFDLINDKWPWSNVSAIHCVCMLYQWDFADAINVIGKCFDALMDGGVLWCGESVRDADPKSGRLSCYTPNSLGRILERAGFTVGICKDQKAVTGRDDSWPTTFALRAQK